MVDVAERDLASVAAGQSVIVRARSYPDRTFTGTVALVYPHLSPATRTVRVRIELPNAEHLLLPDMYAEAEIGTGSGETVVAVPDSAVIDSGDRQIVIIDRGEGRFEPRNVQLGRRGRRNQDALLKAMRWSPPPTSHRRGKQSGRPRWGPQRRRAPNDRTPDRGPGPQHHAGMIATVFAVAAAPAIFHLPLDAIPDLSDTQVITYTEYRARRRRWSDQVTYPLTTAMLIAPKFASSAALFRRVVRLCDLRGR